MNLLRTATSGFARKLVLGLAAPACLLAPLATAAPANASDDCTWNGTNYTCATKDGAQVWDAYSIHVVGHVYGGSGNYNCKNDHGVPTGEGLPHPNRWDYVTNDAGQQGWVADGDVSSNTDILPPCPGT